MEASTYSGAREFFEAVRDAAIELERSEWQIARMRLSEGVRAQRYEVRGAGGGDRSGMSATDARMDFESLMERRVREDREIVARGVRLCYGEEGAGGGVCALLGSLAADSVYWRYCRGASWVKAAEAVGASTKSVQRWCDTAFDTMDAHGCACSVAGIGLAEGKS